MDLSTRAGRREQGRLIQKAIEHSGLSVEEASAKIGCSRALLYQYLSGSTLAQSDRLQALAAVTGASLASFYAAASAELEGESGRSQRVDSDQLAGRLIELESLALAQQGPADWSAAAATNERLIALAHELREAAAEAAAQLRLGKAAIHLGEFGRAVAALDQAVRLFQTFGDNRYELESRQARGNALLAIGRGQEALAEFELVAAGSRWESQWSGAVSLAAVYEQTGDYRLAAEWCDRAADLAASALDENSGRRAALYVKANRVNLFLACGDLALAEPLVRGCLHEAESLGLSDQHLEARLNLALLYLWQGRLVEALQTLNGVHELAGFLGDSSRAAMARALRADAYAALSEWDSAIHEAKEALTWALGQGERRVELFAQMALTDAYRGAERGAEARYHGGQAVATAGAVGITLYECEARLRLGRACLSSGDIVGAEANLKPALRSAEKLGARHLAACGRLLRAEIDLSRGRSAEAGREARAARKQAAAIGAHAQAARAALRMWQAARGNQAAERPVYEGMELAYQWLDGLRIEARSRGMVDALLEDTDARLTYIGMASLLRSKGNPDLADEVIESAGWPPLEAEWQEGKARE